MKIHNINKFPPAYEYQHGTIESLDPSDFKSLGVDEVWYWYASGSYEGSGQMLMRRGNLYDTHDMGHCSCYGPTDQVNFFEGLPLEELKRNMSVELKSYYEDIFNSITHE